MPDTTIIAVRVTEEVKWAARVKAAQQHSNLSDILRGLLEDWLEEEES